MGESRHHLRHLTFRHALRDEKVMPGRARYQGPQQLVIRHHVFVRELRKDGAQGFADRNPVGHVIAHAPRFCEIRGELRISSLKPSA